MCTWPRISRGSVASDTCADFLRASGFHPRSSLVPEEWRKSS